MEGTGIGMVESRELGDGLGGARRRRCVLAVIGGKNLLLGLLPFLRYTGLASLRPLWPEYYLDDAFVIVECGLAAAGSPCSRVPTRLNPVPCAPEHGKGEVQVQRRRGGGDRFVCATCMPFRSTIYHRHRRLGLPWGEVNDHRAYVKNRGRTWGLCDTHRQYHQGIQYPNWRQNLESACDPSWRVLCSPCSVYTARLVWS